MILADSVPSEVDPLLHRIVTEGYRGDALSLVAAGERSELQS